jgi:membrane-associated phospholipid phosphatase
VHHLFVYGLVGFGFPFLLVVAASVPQPYSRDKRTLTGTHHARFSASAGWGDVWLNRETLILALQLAASLILLGLASWIVAALIEHLAANTALANFDATVAEYVSAHRDPAAVDAMWHVTVVGAAWFTAAVAVGAGLAMRFRTSRWEPLFLLVAIFVGAVILEVGLKWAISRARPPASIAGLRTWGSSFPSGHAERAVTIYGAFAWMISEVRRGWRTPAWILAVVLALAVGVSRVYLGVHWTTDVLGAWIIGAIWLAIVIMLAHRARLRGTPPASVKAERPLQST